MPLGGAALAHAPLLAPPRQGDLGRQRAARGEYDVGFFIIEEIPEELAAQTIAFIRANPAPTGS